MSRYIAFFGKPTFKGGYIITEQMNLESKDYDTAWQRAYAQRQGGEQLLILEKVS
jgi:hypothetical protein